MIAFFLAAKKRTHFSIFHSIYMCAYVRHRKKKISLGINKLENIYLRQDFCNNKHKITEVVDISKRENSERNYYERTNRQDRIKSQAEEDRKIFSCILPSFQMSSRGFWVGVIEKRTHSQYAREKWKFLFCFQGKEAYDIEKKSFLSFSKYAFTKISNISEILF